MKGTIRKQGLIYTMQVVTEKGKETFTGFSIDSLFRQLASWYS